MKHLVLILLVLSFLLIACGDDTGDINENQQSAIDKAQNADVYTPKSDLELRNYNWRQEIADSPTTILWCTFAYPVPSSPLITVPIVGKLTSGTKRPYFTSWAENYDTNKYSPEIPGPDGMYGGSGEYRYGFGPGGKAEYYDFYGLASFCTNVPMIWQRESTIIIGAVDSELMATQTQVQQLLEDGKIDEAKALLESIND